MVKFVKLDTVNNENYNPDQNCECTHILSIFAKILKKENMIKFIITNDANQKCLMHETYTEQWKSLIMAQSSSAKIIITVCEK